MKCLVCNKEIEKELNMVIHLSANQDPLHKNWRIENNVKSAEDAKKFIDTLK